MDHNLAIKALTKYFGARGYPSDYYPKILKKEELLIATGRHDFNAAYKHANEDDKYYKEWCCHKEVDKIYDKIATLESTEYMNKNISMRKEIIDNLFDAYMVYIYTLATRIIDGSLIVID